jgi:hypothetical protein
VAKAFAHLDVDPEREAQERLEAFDERTPAAFIAPPPEPAIAPDDLKAECSRSMPPWR